MLTYLRERFARGGAELHDSKLKVWSSTPASVPASLSVYITDDPRCLGRSVAAAGDEVHQGMPVSQITETMEKECHRLQTLTRSLQALLKSGLDKQTALALLRAYAGPAIQYTMRSGGVSGGAARRYDEELARSWSALLGRTVSENEARLWLPARMGGCGACSAQTLSAAAPWAAWSTVIDEVCSHLGLAGSDDFFSKCPDLQQSLSSLQAHLIDQGTIGSISHATTSRALASPVRQRTLVSYIHKIHLRTLRSSMDDDRAAFHRSASGPGAAAFLDPPLDDRWVLADNRFVTACLRRLGQKYPMFAAPPVTAPTCSNTTADGRMCGATCDPYGQHLELCAPGGGLIERHDDLVKCVSVLASRALDPRPRLEQVVPELSQPVGGQIGQARLDVILHDGANRMLVDVVVVSPFAGGASYRAACARRDGHSCRRAAVAKRRRYPSNDLVPFALETGGRLGADARALLARMAAASADPAREILYLQRAISSILQDGVSRQLLK